MRKEKLKKLLKSRKVQVLLFFMICGIVIIGSTKFMTNNESTKENTDVDKAVEIDNNKNEEDNNKSEEDNNNNEEDNDNKLKESAKVEEEADITQPPITSEETESTPAPTYSSLAEVKQRLINYGQSLGYIYNPSLEGAGLNIQDIKQLNENENGNIVDVDLDSFFKAMQGNEFGISVEKRDDGYIWMTLWVNS
ncbi:hypothetical protein [uncultured Clostridium sp.]|uniref:hypothetical protein n=1 Tax=uncultured Clostridium sp. TaxID=59620 RepID=UPI0025D04528|nr:hypothetical protein [uncultured Clostridium sp.]